jgi:hypothetical protein
VDLETSWSLLDAESSPAGKRSSRTRGARRTESWQWDGQRWTEIPLTGPTPGYRYQPIMVYDRARDRTVLYGGLDGSRADTWEWDGQRWREIKP